MPRVPSPSGALAARRRWRGIVSRMHHLMARWLSEPWVPPQTMPEQHRPIVLDDPTRPVEARILWRPALAAGTEIVGPAVIEEPNSTTLIGSGDCARVNDSGHLVIELGPSVS